VISDQQCLLLDIMSGARFKERKEGENEPRNIVVRFVTHRVGRLSSSSSLCHPSSSTSSSSRPCCLSTPGPSSVSPLVVVVSPSGFARRQRRRFRPCRSLGLRRLPPSPDPTSIETNPPTSHGRGGWGCNLACEGAEAVLMKPTSLNRGEGLVCLLICDVRGVEGEGEGEGGGGGGRRE